MHTTQCVVFVVSLFVVIDARNLNYTRRGFMDTIFQSVADIVNVVLNPPEEDTHPQTHTYALEDAHLNITQLATKYGYLIEEHTVQTDDGYILKVHRIPRGKKKDPNNLVVFLMHGFVESSDSWVLQGPDNALAYILADEGFDVWMGNARGNKYANRHTIMDPKDSDFWQFTWEEIGVFDLPSMIDYALNVTGQESLHYMGYSQGATSFYVMSSLKPEYTRKVKMMFALAPVAWMAHVRSPLVKMFSPASNVLGNLLLNSYTSSTDFLSSMFDSFCFLMSSSCKTILSMIIGNESKHLTGMLPVILGHMPTTSSVLQLVHFGQLVKSERFCRFDHGEEVNYKFYGSATPPDYDLSNLTVPVAIFYGENDWLAAPEDVQTLRKHLPNVIESNLIEEFNHMDFIYAGVAKEVLYSRIMRLILKFDGLVSDDL